MIGQNYALFRLPHERDYTRVSQTSGTVATFSTIEQLDGAEGFVVAPFEVGDDAPIVCLRADEVTRAQVRSVGAYEGVKVGASEPTWEYVSAFSRFKYALDKGDYDKLVLSRQCRVRIPDDFSAEDVFMRACELYPRMMVYLVCTEVTGTWLGCTPEILLSGSAENYRTVALAGTMSLDSVDPSGSTEDYPLSIWNEKNRREQGFVEQYIEECLSSIGRKVCKRGPFTARAGRLLHIKSEFDFRLRPSCSVASALSVLHPTPAVCGLPKHEAEAFIRQHEGCDRSYYSGFVGSLGIGGRTDIYVNLRCMKVESDSLRLYAGGGILSSSFMQQEWTETQEKMKTLLNIL